MTKLKNLDGLMKGINDVTKQIDKVKQTGKEIQRTTGLNTKKKNSSSSTTNKHAGWLCSCGTHNTTKFCGGCGKPEETNVHCPNCGLQRPSENLNQKFCGGCGTELVTSAAHSVSAGFKHPSGSATGLRFFAILLWILAFSAAIMAVLIINQTIYTADHFLTWLFVALGIDLVFVIIASALWKKSNRIAPASSRNKLKFWLWNNLGVIASVICFFPVFIVLLKNKQMDKKSKQLITIVATLALCIAGLSSFDWEPVSVEDYVQNTTEQLQNSSQVSDAVISSGIYWTTFGKKYHLSKDCSSLSRSNKIIDGSLEEAFQANRRELCSFCARDFNVK